MTKPDMTLLFHDKKVYIFLMIWVDSRTRPGRKLQLPFMCCLAPLPGRTASFQLSFFSGTGSTSPGDQTEGCGSARGNAKARVSAAHVPSPASPGTPQGTSGTGQHQQLCPRPADRRGEAGERRRERARSRERCRMYRGPGRLPARGTGGSCREKLCKASV